MRATPARKPPVGARPDGWPGRTATRVQFEYLRKPTRKREKKPSYNNEPPPTHSLSDYRATPSAGDKPMASPVSWTDSNERAARRRSRSVSAHARPTRPKMCSANRRSQTHSLPRRLGIRASGRSRYSVTIINELAAAYPEPANQGHLTRGVRSVTRPAMAATPCPTDR